MGELGVSGYIAEAELTSGFIWISLIVLFAYLFYEHQVREKFPQNLILLLLFIDTCLRCVWFFLAVDYRSAIYTTIINRVAILSQFTAISVLMLMWLRALQITQMTWDLSHRHVEQTVSPETFMSSSAADTASRTTTTSNNNPRQKPNNADKKKMAAQPVTPRRQVLDEATIRAEAERKQQIRIRIVIVCNICTWCFILGSCASADEDWYTANLIMISVLCLAEAVITLTIGVRTSLMLQKELAPVFQLNNVNLTTQTKLKNEGFCQRLNDYFGCADLFSLYQLFFSPTESALGLQLQRDVLKTLLNVSFIVFIFFLLRSFSFIYSPNGIENLTNGNGYDSAVGAVLYPLFYYQFPESIPNLAIALGISPPNSILRKAVRWIKTNICCYSLISHLPNAILSGSSYESGSNIPNDTRSTVVLSRTELADAFSLYATEPPLPPSDLPDSSLSAAMPSSASPTDRNSSNGNREELEKDKADRQIARALNRLTASSKVPSNLKRGSNPHAARTKSRSSLAPLPEETVEDSASYDLETGNKMEARRRAEENPNDCTSDVENVEEKDLSAEREDHDPLDRRTTESYNLSETPSQSESSTRAPSFKSSFNISKPIPINAVNSGSIGSGTNSKRRSKRRSRNRSEGDDSYLYDEEELHSGDGEHSKALSSTEASSSVPSAVQSGSGFYSSSAPRSVHTVTNNSSQPDPSEPLPSSPTILSPEFHQFPFNSPVNVFPSLMQLSRERSVDPNNAEYLEFLYRINSIGSYTSTTDSYRSNEYETNPLYRSRSKRADSAGVVGPRKAQPPPPPSSNTTKWNWYSQFW